MKIILIFSILFLIAEVLMSPDRLYPTAPTGPHNMTRSEEIAAGTARINSSLSAYCASHSGC